MENDKLKRRIHNIQGQLDGILKMIESDKGCVDTLIQFKAARSGLDSVISLFLQQNLKLCLGSQNLPAPKQAEMEKIITELSRS